MTTEFADVADPYQSPLDVAAYAAAGHDRILIKATEGLGYTNPRFGAWWQAAGAAGMARGAYHFARPSQAAGDVEASHFLAPLMAHGMTSRDWLVLDIEDEDAGGPARAAAYVAAFTGWLASHGIGGLVYTGRWYADPAGITAATVAPSWRRLHLSDYTDAADDAIALPAGWGRESVFVRQFTNAAPTAGVPRPCDRSRVIHEWLPEDDMPLSDDDVARVAGAVLDLLREQVFAGQTPPHQADVGSVLRRTYEMAGASLGTLGPLATSYANLIARIGALEKAIAAGSPALGRVAVAGELTLTTAPATPPPSGS